MPLSSADIPGNSPCASLFEELEGLDAEKLAVRLRRPSPSDDRCLRLSLGNERVDHLHLLAVKAESAVVKRAGLVVLLSDFSREPLPTAELMLALSRRWRVYSFRCIDGGGLPAITGELQSAIENWRSVLKVNPTDRKGLAPVHLVGVGFGGLVALAIAGSNSASRQWATGRVILIGTPIFVNIAETAVLPSAGTAPRSKSTNTAANSGGLGAEESQAAANPIAREWQEVCRDAASSVSSSSALARAVAIWGYGEPTPLPSRGIGAGADAVVRFTDRGDGYTYYPEFKTPTARNYFVRAKHNDLARHPLVLRAVDDLLENGATSLLPDSIQSSGARGFLGAGPVVAPGDEEGEPGVIRIGLVLGRIEEVDRLLGSGGNRPGAISVATYSGVKLGGACLAIDRAISEELMRKELKSLPSLRDEDLLLTQFVGRGVLRGDLGHVFLLPDPRWSQRVIAVCGMGVPAQFGAAELSVLAREVCWTVGRLGKNHLATVLVRGGTGLLTLREATLAWLRGIKSAITGAPPDDPWTLRRITFVEEDPRRIEEIQDALVTEQERLRNIRRLKLIYDPITGRELLDLRRKAKARAVAEARRLPLVPQDEKDAAPVVITISQDKEGFRFAAMTEGASVPERSVHVDPSLISEANDELAKAQTASAQSDKGKFLAELLLPDEFSSLLNSGAPLVMLVDATTARIHWELVARPDLLAGTQGSTDEEALFPSFFGGGMGLTRQLRTSFARVPDRQVPVRRRLRVLIVADPAADAHLPGAEAEGIEIAELFEAFNRVYAGTENQIELVTLFGPNQATRAHVLEQLMLRTYDLFHFAGHCVWDAANPEASGWLFTGNERLRASEISRIDRVPSFVFSNACESGVTPDRFRSAELAPTLAESLFGRGVNNFVCTAWPIDDKAARRFALRLYSGLVGLRRTAEIDGSYVAVESEKMRVAMREARLEIFRGSGLCTWGAYQHYGDPNARLFDARALHPPKERKRDAGSRLRKKGLKPDRS